MVSEKKPAEKAEESAVKDSKAASDTVDPSKADPSDTLKVIDKKSGP